MIFLAEGTISFFDLSFRSGPLQVQKLVVVFGAVYEGDEVKEYESREVQHFVELIKGGFPPGLDGNQARPKTL